MDDQLAYNGAQRGGPADAVAFHPDQIRNWQSEVAAFLGQCLAEIDAVSAMLQSIDEPGAGETPPQTTVPARPPAASPTGGVDRDAAFREPASAARAPEPKPADDGDYNARLANLKKMLAEKLQG